MVDSATQLSACNVSKCSVLDTEPIDHYSLASCPSYFMHVRNQLQDPREKCFMLAMVQVSRSSMTSHTSTGSACPLIIVIPVSRMHIFMMHE